MGLNQCWRKLTNFTQQLRLVTKLSEIEKHCRNSRLIKKMTKCQCYENSCFKQICEQLLYKREFRQSVNQIHL